MFYEFFLMDFEINAASLVEIYVSMLKSIRTKYNIGTYM